MDTIRAILTRRSIRKFKPDPVPPDLLEELVRCAMAAPSAMNEQPWHFVVVDDPDRLEQLFDHPAYHNIRRPVPAAIVVCGEPALEKFAGFWEQDCSAAVQNLLLAAHDRGLGAVWTAAHPLAEAVARLRELLGIPSTIVPLAAIALGWPDEALPTEDRFRADRVHRNRW